HIGRFGNGCGFLGLVASQLAFVLAFVQITDAGCKLSAGEWPPDSFRRTSDLSPILRLGEIRVGTQISRDLRGPRLINVKVSGLQGRVHHLELVPDLLPSECGLSRERSKRH